MTRLLQVEATGTTNSDIGTPANDDRCSGSFPATFEECLPVRRVSMEFLVRSIQATNILSAKPDIRLAFVQLCRSSHKPHIGQEHRAVTRRAGQRLGWRPTPPNSWRFVCLGPPSRLVAIVWMMGQLGDLTICSRIMPLASLSRKPGTPSGSGVI